MAPRYGNVKVGGGVGYGNKGFLNLKTGQSRSRTGQFTGGGTERAGVKSWNWRASAEQYRNQSLTGQTQQLLGEIQAWANHVQVESKVALKNALIPAFEKSQYYCPKSPSGSRGTPIRLVESGKLTVTKETGGKITAKITYGFAGNPFYAAYVHEILTYRHDPPTRAKFLEQALKEHMDQIKDDLGSGMKQAMGAK
jgi:hypothetical protein